MSFDPTTLGLMKKQLPCYDTRKTAPLSIEWDGEIGGREAFGEGNEMLVKVSSSTPSFEELQAGDFLVSGTDEYQKITSENSEYYEEDGLAFLASNFIYVVYDDNNYLGLSKGIWFGKFIVGDGSIYISHMRVPSVTTGELKTIDPKYLSRVKIHLQDYGVNLYLALFDPSYPTEFENQQLYDVFSNACALDKDIILCCGAELTSFNYNDIRIRLTQITKAANGTYIGAGKVCLGAGNGKATWGTVTIETRETNGLLWIAVHIDEW